MSRFEARKMLISGRPWWIIWDVIHGKQSSSKYLSGKFRTRRQAETHIRSTIKLYY